MPRVPHLHPHMTPAHRHEAKMRMRILNSILSVWMEANIGQASFNPGWVGTASNISVCLESFLIFEYLYWNHYTFVACQSQTQVGSIQKSRNCAIISFHACSDFIPLNNFGHRWKALACLVSWFSVKRRWMSNTCLSIDFHHLQYVCGNGIIFLLA